MLTSSGTSFYAFVVFMKIFNSYIRSSYKSFYSILIDILFIVCFSFPVITFANENNSDQNKQNTTIEEYAQKCIINATKIVSLNNKTIDLTGTFNNCYKGKNSNNPLVWFFIGYMQLNGIGASMNIAEGIKYLEKAGYKSVPAAQKELSDYYLTGGGVKNKIDIPKAVDWLSRLALNKSAEYSPDATFKLCSIYLFGTGIPSDYERAFTWCKRSGLDQHNYEGLTNLALLYINGWGTKKEPSLAIDYYTTAAKHGVISAQLSLGRAYSLGTEIPTDYKLAFEWMAKASQNGSPLAMFYLAQMYEYGQGVTQDKVAAKKLYQKSAELGEAQSQYILGRIYQYDDNSNINYAAKWYHKAAAQNNSDAMIAIGDLYQTQNTKEMMKWYRKASALGNIDGKLRQIPYLLKGTKEFRAHPEDALAMAEELSQQNNSYGNYWLGIIFRDGYVGNKDVEKAQYEFSLAASDGNLEAALELGLGYLYNSFNTYNEDLAEKYLIMASSSGCLKSSCLELGKLYIKQNKKEEAKEILQQGIENPDRYIKNETLQLLNGLNIKH